ncbi:ATP-binding protein [Aquisalimonas sp.]|uniref:sensor histidine kinase n=1 Tax=Aquisalimonas sp. TaxID=1872621 RepID=UPI0025BBB850|nr:ATP-binding protein [Aquisalimonas sp.]
MSNLQCPGIPSTGAELFQPLITSEVEGLLPLLDRLPVGAYMCDADGLITYYNQLAVELWGRAPKLNDPEDRYCGSFRLSSFDGAPIRHERCWMALALRDQAAYNGREILVERPDGERRMALAHANPVFDGNGALRGAVNMLTDITEQKRKESEWRTMQTAFAHLGRLSLAGEMAAGLAHELNQPLAAIVNYSVACQNQVRDDTNLPDDLVAKLERISEQGLRAGEIIRRLRAFTRRESINTGSMDLLATIRQAVDFMEHELRTAGVQLVLDDILRMPPVKADPVQIQQVLLNLMRNSVEAMLECPTENRVLTIRFPQRLDGHVELSVEDTGPGLNPAVTERLFYPFMTTKPEGMGLGLVISKSIIEAHNGQLWASLDNSQGARFHFTLPVTA